MDPLWNNRNKFYTSNIHLNEDAVENKIKSLLSRLKYECGDEVANFFVPEAVCGAEDALLDPVTMSDFSPDDEGLENFDNNDNYNFVPIQLQEDLAKKMMLNKSKLKGSGLSGY